MRPITVLMIGILIFGFGVPSLHAELNSITNSGTIFVGEENLNLGATGLSTNEKVGYWGPGTQVKTSSPEKIVTISDINSFYVDPGVFAERTGPWYTVNDRNLAFYVEHPQLNLRLYDTTANFDATGKWVPKGDQISFKIDTNLIAMKDRIGVMGAPVSIRIKSQNGTEYNSLTSSSGNTIRLSDILVTGSPFTMPVTWNTGGYQSGNYIVWAECNANKMMDNYEVIGETISNDKNTPNLLIQDKNPLITNEKTVSAEISNGTSPAKSGQDTHNISLNTTSLAITKVAPNTTLLNQTPGINMSFTNQTPLDITRNETPQTILPTTTTKTPATTKSTHLGILSGVLALFMIGYFATRRSD